MFACFLCERLALDRGTGQDHYFPRQTFDLLAAGDGPGQDETPVCSIPFHDDREESSPGLGKHNVEVASCGCRYLFQLVVQLPPYVTRDSG